METPEYIRTCLIQINDHYRLGGLGQWTQGDIEYFREDLYTKTGILISDRTLKRIIKAALAEHDTYNPQIETKNALAAFLGYKNWSDFKQANPPFIHQGQEQLTQPATEGQRLAFDAPQKQKSKTALIVAISAIFFVLCLFSYLLVYVQSHEDYSTVKFSSKYNKGLAPLTAVFEYDVSKLKTDSIYLKIANKDKFKIPKDKRAYTQSFHIPSYSKVSLMADSHVIAHTYVHAMSDGWMYAVYNWETLPYYKKVQPRNGSITVMPAETQPYNQHDDHKYKTSFLNFMDYPVLVDNSTIELRLKNQPVKGIYCNLIMINLWGEHERYKLSFADKGCFDKSNLIISEIEKIGRYTDLNSFGQDLSDWRTIKIVTRNKHVRILIDEKQIYETTYKKTVGKLKGIYVEYTTTGGIDFVRISDDKGQIKYFEDFGGPALVKP